MFKLGRIGRIDGAGKALAAIVIVMLMSACQLQPAETSEPTPLPPGASSTSALPAPVSSPSGNNPSPTDASSGATKDATTFIRDDGTGVISAGMTVAAFRRKAAVLGWSCSPKTGTDKYGTITVGLNQFNFVNGRLYFISIEDPAFSTERGLRVGDSVDTMKRLYGKPDDTAAWPGDGGGTDYSYASASSLSMGVTAKSGRVVNITFRA